MRLDQLGDEIFVAMIIIEAGDSLSVIEQEIGFSILTNLFDDIRYPDQTSLGSKYLLSTDLVL
jgi:hypothetical protein